MKEYDTYRARWAIFGDSKQAGKTARDIGIIISDCFALAKKKLHIQVTAWVVCPECEKKKRVRKEEAGG